MILSQTDGTNTMYFQYDTNGTPLGFIYNGTQYLYMTNQMGDVIGLTKATGEIFAEYVYDEWGKVIVIRTDNQSNEAIANINPIRYRGYYYDSETGYYYLQSRYYDPSICRFINADDLSFITTTDINSFAYCVNNPVNQSDSTGTSSSLNYWKILSKFLKNYLLRGKTIVKYTKMVKDQYNLHSSKVYYKKSKNNTNVFNITFGNRMAWKKNTTWLNNIGKNQKTINNYWSKINSIMTSGAPVTQAQADTNKAQIISSNIGMGIQIIKVLCRKKWIITF